MAALQVLDGELWQWDTGREVEVVGCEQVHFAKSTTGTCYTVAVANSKAKIPDELLQAAGRVYAWAYITDEAYGGRTRIEALWDVKRRAKPAEYIYEPSDQRTIKDAETARDEAKAAQKAAEAARDRAVAAEVKGARATTLASGSDATAAMEGNVLVVGVPKGDALRYSDLTAEQVAELKKPASDAAAEIGKTNEEYKAMLTEQAKAFGDAQRARAESYTDAERARDEAYAKAETDRDTAYNEAEGKRQAAERVRGENEGARKTAETGRDTAEKARVEAEAKREQGWTDLKADAEKSVSDAVERADAANKAATKAIAEVKATEAKLYPVAENVLRGTAKDTFVHVDDAFHSTLLGIEIEGATEQVTTTGKNIVKLNEAKKTSNGFEFDVKATGQIVINGTNSGKGVWLRIGTVDVVEGKTYCLSLNRAYSKFGVSAWSDSENRHVVFASAKVQQAKGTATKTETLSIFAVGGEGMTLINEVVSVQVEEGASATSWEPYTGGKPSPSHEYPQEIRNLSKAELKVAGKNLADVGKSDNVNFVLRKEPLPAGTYTFSCDKGQSSGFIFNIKPIDDSGKVIGGDIASCSTSPRTFTISEPKRLFINGWGLNNPFIIGSIQLEAGSKATDFEPISKPKATQIDLKGNELCSLVENLDWNPKTFKDELVIDSEGNVSLIKRVFSAHIDGSEPMWLSNTDKFQYFNYTPKTVRPIDGSNAIRSNRFGKVSRKPWSFYVAGGSNAALFFTFPLGTFANADELNEWLSKNPIDANYLGAESQTIPLGKIELPALPESVSNVWTDAGVTPKTGIEYTRDVNIVVANLESAIASIS